MQPRTLFPLVTLALVACAPTIDSAARQASRGAVDEGAEELTRQDTQQSLEAAAKDPEMQAAVAAMTDQIAQSVLKSIESERGREQLAVLTKTITQSFGQQLVATLTTPQARGQLVGLTRAVSDAALTQAAETMQTQFRPVVRAMIQEDIAAGMASALEGELRPELGRAAQNVAYHAVLGANDGLGAAWLEDGGMASEARTLSNTSRAWLWGGVSLLGLIALMLASGAVMMVAAARRTRSEVARLESATLLLATAMRERQETQNTDEIVAIVQKALEGRAEQTGKHRVLGALRLRKHE